MVDPTTVNKFLSQPTSGTDLGTWGVPINNNMDIIDASFGSVATVALSSLPVALSSTQYQCAFIRLTGALLANVTLSFPSLGSFYTIINDTTNSSAFFVTAATTIATRVIGLPPGTMTDVLTSSGTVRFRGLPHVGAYWDYSGSSSPAWLAGCTIPPWLYCNGTTFAAATYPSLAVILGSTTLPDLRGRQAFNYNDGTGRITSSGGIDGNTLYAAGGIQNTALSTLNMPAINPFPMIDNGHTHNIVVNNARAGGQSYTANSNPTANAAAATITINNSQSFLTVGSGGGNGAFSVMPPASVAGLRFIRAA